MTFKVIRGQGHGEETISVPFWDYFLSIVHVCAACGLPASTAAAGSDDDIPTVVKKLPASIAAESAEHLVMETKLKIIEILQVSLSLLLVI